MECIEEKGDYLLIHVHVQPRASKNEVTGIHGGSLKVRLTSPPVEGAANSLLSEFVAKKLGIAKSKIEIVSGERSRHKTLKIADISREEAVTALGILP